MLKVPSGERSLPHRDVIPVSQKSPSNIAYRRSQSNGRSPAPLDRRGSDESLRPPSRRDEIIETTDLRTGSRLGPGYRFSAAQWGFRGERASCFFFYLCLPLSSSLFPCLLATSNKIATSFSNGAVALWDLEKEGNRVGTLLFPLEIESREVITVTPI